MKFKSSVPFLLFLFLLLGSFEQTLACWCRGVSSCEATNSADTVFAGKVVKIVKDEDDGSEQRSMPERERVVFQVKEVFLGEKSKTITIKTGGGDDGGGDCDYFGFVENETYLVYAHKSSEMGLRVGRCGGTKLLAKAAEDTKYLKGHKTSDKNSSIFATIAGVTFNPILKVYSGGFLPGIPLQISGNGVNKTLFTDVGGDVEILGLRAVTYRVQVFLPAYYDFFRYGEDDSIREIKLNGRGCAREYFSPGIKNTLAGRVLDENGKALENINISLVPAVKRDDDNADDTYTTETDGKGNYIFEDIFPRSYYLGINIEERDAEEEIPEKLFYPGTPGDEGADIIEFGLGGHLKEYNLTWHRKVK